MVAERGRPLPQRFQDNTRWRGPLLFYRSGIASGINSRANVFSARSTRARHGRGPRRAGGAGEGPQQPQGPNSTPPELAPPCHTTAIERAPTAGFTDLVGFSSLFSPNPRGNGGPQGQGFWHKAKEPFESPVEQLLGVTLGGRGLGQLRSSIFSNYVSSIVSSSMSPLI